jgi:hypothetical protein
MEATDMSDTTTNRTSRARFLGGAAALAFAAGVLPGRAGAAGAAGAAEPRAYSTGHFSLELDGQAAGVLRGVAGGEVYADVASQQPGGSAPVKKHIAGLKYEPFEVAAPFAPGPLMAWIAAALRQDTRAKSGTVVEASYDLSVLARRDFFDALITEVSFPTMEASNKDQGAISVKLAPEFIRAGKAGGKLPASPAAKAAGWSPGNFRFELDGVDCTRVSRIDGFTVGQSYSGGIGTDREPEIQAGKLEVPNLKVTLSEQGAAGFTDWFDKFVIRGNCAEEDEKKGAIVFLSADRMTEIGRINLYNVGIFRLSPEPLDAGAESIRRMAAHLYVERMELLVK